MIMNNKYDNYMNTIEKDSVIEFEGNEYTFVRYDGDYMLCENNESFTINDFYEDLEFGDNRRYKMWAKLDYNDQGIANMKTVTQKYKIEEECYKKQLEKREQVQKEAVERFKAKDKTIFLNSQRKRIKVKDLTEEDMKIEEEFGQEFII